MSLSPHGSSPAGRRMAIVVAALAAAFFAWQGWAFVNANAQTYDEATHLAAGWLHLTKQDFAREPQNPPLLKMLFALPVQLAYHVSFEPRGERLREGTDWHIGLDFLFGSSLPAERVLVVARLPNVGLGVALVWLVGWWAYRLWGPRAAIVALVLAAADPNLLAYSSLATTDTGASLFVLLTVYLFWEHARAPSLSKLLGAGLAMGLGLVSKYSCVLLPGIVGGIALAHVSLGSRVPLLGLDRRAGVATLPARCLEAGAALGVMAVVAALLIPPAYWFSGYSFWWSGLQEFVRLGRVGQPAFFWGEYSYSGWWSYYPVGLLLKTPVGTLALLGASLVLWRVPPRIAVREAVFLLTPVAVFFAALSQARVNIGIRHALPVCPFLFVLAARTGALRARRRWLAPAFVAVALAATTASSTRTAPHQLAYFNEIVGGPDEGYRYLSDSAVDWGQDLYGLRDYLAKEGVDRIYLSYFGTAPPERHGIRYQYVPGCWPLSWPPPSEWVPVDAVPELLAVSVTNLQGTAAPWKNLFGWLSGRTPRARIGHSIFVYDITRDAGAHSELARGYLLEGLYEAGAFEARKVLRLEPGSADGTRLLEAATRGSGT